MLTSLNRAADVLDATGGDPFARRVLARPGEFDRGWSAGGAVGWSVLLRGMDVPWLSLVGPPEEVPALVHGIACSLTRPHRVTLPRCAVPHLPPGLELTGRSDWDFRWTVTVPPKQRREADAVVLDASEADEVAVLLAVANPTTSAQPGRADIRRWIAVRGADGRLNACAADTSHGLDLGHISAVATRPQCRGQGLGAAVSAALTRSLQEEFGLVTLGVYADNAVGRRLYDRLGFADTHHFTSGDLAPVK